MGKITDMDGRDASAGRPVEELTDDPGLIDLLNCQNTEDLKAVWLSRQCKADDVQIVLLFQIATEINRLGSAIQTLLNRLTIVPH